MDSPREVPRIHDLPKSGEAVTSPVWTVGLEDGGSVWTAMGSGKTKRLKNNSAITVQPARPPAP